MSNTDAWIAAGAGVAGALAGGSATGWITYKLEGKRQKFALEREERVRARDEEAEQAVIRGAARVLDERFQRFAGLIKAALGEGQYLKDMATDIESEISLEDRKLIARSLSAEEWAVVLTADFAVVATMSMSGSISEQGKGNAERRLGSVKAGRKALSRLSGLEPSSSVPESE
jgi:hypothetical protein